MDNLKHLPPNARPHHVTQEINRLSNSLQFAQHLNDEIIPAELPSPERTFWARLTAVVDSAYGNGSCYSWEAVTPAIDGADPEVLTWETTGEVGDGTVNSYAYPINNFSAEVDAIVKLTPVNSAANGIIYLFTPSENPRGLIQMWSGAPDAVPAGWGLCDGTTERGLVKPDLRARFIVGYDERTGGSIPSYGDADYQTIGETGGYKLHGFDAATGNNENNHLDHEEALIDSLEGPVGTPVIVPPDSTSYYQHTMTDNRPSWYVLAYVIKL